MPSWPDVTDLCTLGDNECAAVYYSHYGVQLYNWVLTSWEYCHYVRGLWML